MEQQTKDKYELVDEVLVSCVSMTENVDHTRPIGAFFELTGKIWTEGGRVQAKSMPSVKMRSGRKAARLAAGRKVVRRNKETGS